MDAKELRIGNWVLQDGVPTQITGYMFHAEFEGLYEIEDEFYPIPLTPEILEKAGFVEIEDGVNGGSSYNSYKAWKAKGMILCSVGDVIHLWEECEDAFYSYYHTKINNLHQLQNLYFALTGKELPIEL